MIIETWNDFNEGSEIEPIEGDDPFQYVALTASNIALYKNKPSHLEGEASLLNAVVKIYEAAALIETDERDETVFYEALLISKAFSRHTKLSSFIEAATCA